MSLEEIEWTESEGDTDDNLVLEHLSDNSDDEHEFDRALSEKDAGSARSRRARDEELDPEVEEAYHGARGLYTNGDYDGALTLLEEAIKHEAGSKLLFNLVASIHEERSDYEKALLARIHVAHLDKRDKDTWIDIAERSVALGHLGQAAWCYQHVSRLDRENWHWLRTRADLHLQLGQHSAASTLLQRIRAKFFPVLDHDSKTQVLLGLAGALKELGRVDEATQIYMDIFTRNVTSLHKGDKPEVDLDWQNLNILCELLTDQKMYAEVVVTVKSGARWINGRGRETYWQEFSLETDSEFDDRRWQLITKLPQSQRQAAEASCEANPQAYDMPIDIRIWLLQSRLKMIPSHLLLNARNTAQIESLGVVEDAKNHLTKLKECTPVDTYGDLYKKAALSFFDARLYFEARELYIMLTDIDHETMEEYLDMNVQVAKCEMELHNVVRAETLYKYVLERNPDDQEALVAMGEIYAATNRVSESRVLLLKLEDIRSRELRDLGATSKSDMANSGDAGNPNHEMNDDVDECGAGNVFVNDSVRPRAANARPNRAARAEIERVIQSRADAAFSGLARFQSGVDAFNSVAAKEWLRYADELIEMFASHRKFFPADRQKDFFSFDGSSNSSVAKRLVRLRLAQEDQLDSEDDMDDDAHDGSDVYEETNTNNNENNRGTFTRGSVRQGDKGDALTNFAEYDAQLMDASDSVTGQESVDLSISDEKPTREEMEDSYLWRGQPLSMWFWVFLQCAFVHSSYGNSARAHEVIQIAQAANVFSLNSKHVETMQFVALSCAYRAGDSVLLGDLLRQLQTQQQFNTVAFQLYICLLTGTKSSLEVFGSSNNQKFFLRQIKALDSLVHHKKPVPGMAKVVDPANAPSDDDPQMLMLYVYIMLLGPSYAPALAYLIRVRAILPNHPLVLLVYGVVQMHRVTQRTSLNRHLQLLEGLSFMLDYQEARGTGSEARQETMYNTGRFFHGVGLLTNAIRYYNKALEMRESVAPEDDLSREAAYNLHLIYAASNNMALSSDIVDTYLTI